MLTRQNKIGLVLAFLLGLSDIAILAALGDDSSVRPPMWIVVISVVLGLATVVLVVLAWRAPTWPLMIGIIGLRAISGLGNLLALGENAAVVTISLIMLALSVVCIALLRNWIKREQVPGHEQRHAVA
jgi:hypothetical protein